MIWPINHFICHVQWCKCWNFVHQTPHRTNLTSFEFNFRLPFTEATPLGYATAYLIQCAAMFSILVGVATAVCHLIGSCWLIVGFVEDISIELPTLNADDDEESCPNERELTERLINIIQLHSHVKQLSEIQFEIDLKNYIKRFTHFRFRGTINEIYEFKALLIYMYTYSGVCTSLLILLTQSVEYTFVKIDFFAPNYFNFSKFLIIFSKLDSNVHPIEMVNTVFRILWSYMLFWIFCSCGGMVTVSFNTFDDELYQCDWYALPIGAQQLLTILIGSTQQHNTIRGYGNVICSRNTFLKVSIGR